MNAETKERLNTMTRAEMKEIIYNLEKQVYELQDELLRLKHTENQRYQYDLKAIRLDTLRLLGFENEADKLKDKVLYLKESEQILRVAAKELKKNLDIAWKQRQANRPYTIDMFKPE